MTEERAKYFFYVVQCADNTFYGGYSTDVAARVATHNAGKGAKYTKRRLPVELVYSEGFASQHDALSAEWHFKHQPRADKERFLRAHGAHWRRGAVIQQH
ncbi:GIY-YIG nuclease family protein [uncultured Lacticaseibacillus sp.]|jgi:putative endonuclease|uniref:GIY-YIG nuclease family protein n=1 Tax=uncultured Lacticaseibacillus sp. TaxID=2775882 RepID=UPI0025929BE9|nr:GIY-YIG nuclease family protein [uncultured Lacticaseibacillus sp.]